MQTRLSKPEFTANDPSNACCFHACMHMVMNGLGLTSIPTFSEIDTILQRKPGQYSWPYAMLPYLAQRGIKSHAISLFDTEKFVKHGASYLIEYMGEEATTVQLARCDLETVIEAASRFLTHHSATDEIRIPTIEDIKSYLLRGWYAMPMVNPRRLIQADGYAAHFILLYDFDANGVLYHDPGHPPRPEQHIGWDIFEYAWSSPDINAREVTFFSQK